MTNEEKDLLMAYLVDAGDIDPDGDVEAQFLEWCQVRDQVVSGEVHYKAVLEAARVRQRSYQEGRLAGGWPRPQPSWDGTSWQPSPGFTALWTTSTKGRGNPGQPPVWPTLAAEHGPE